MMEGFFMSKKPDDDRMQQLQELARETVRLQARRAMSPQEERLLANNLIDVLLGRGAPEELRSLDSEDSSNAPAAASASPLDDLVAQIMGLAIRPVWTGCQGYPSKSERRQSSPPFLVVMSYNLA
jgi:hypothetical protein